MPSDTAYDLLHWGLPHLLVWMMWRDKEKVNELPIETIDQHSIAQIAFRAAAQFARENPEHIIEHCSGQQFSMPIGVAELWNQAHSTLMEKLSLGQLRAFGSKGKRGLPETIPPEQWSALIFVSDPVRAVHKDHFARERPEWHDIRVLRDEVLRLWPPQDTDAEIENGEATSIKENSSGCGIAAETRCRIWLTEQMRKESLNNTRPRKTKAAYRQEALKHFGVSARGFGRCWPAAIRESGNYARSKPGRKSGPKS